MTVAPDWPLLAIDEDAEQVWLHPDASPAWALRELTGWGIGDRYTTLLHTGRQRTVYHREGYDEASVEGWCLTRAHDDEEHEVVVYQRLEVVEACGRWDEDGERSCGLPDHHDGDHAFVADPAEILLPHGTKGER